MTGVVKQLHSGHLWLTACAAVNYNCHWS